MTADRKEWKRKVKERIAHVEKWEWSKGKKWEGEAVVRDVAKVDMMEFVFVCEVCGKVCKSKGGLTIHRKRMHEISMLKKVFQCDRCKDEFNQEANLKNHKKLCTGAAGRAAHTRKCDLCGREIGKKSFARHRRGCADANEEERVVVVQPTARVYKGKRKNCPECGKNMAATNVRRHLNEACPGGGVNL